jgi:hypothetical protein
MGKTLSELKREAGQACSFRGHNMDLWQEVTPTVACSECTVCDAYVEVRTKPMPNEIDIGGTAVALHCD